MEHHRSENIYTQAQTFGRYKVCKLIGEGAMGRVYLAEDPVLDRRVAIKVIAVDKQLDNRTREEYLKRFDLEAKASAKLNHPSIVAIFDAGNEAGIPWIAFEYVEGDRLEDLIAPPKLLPFDKILSIMIDISSALHHAHQCGIVHRDIKPANILIDRRTQIAKLSDFGVMKAPWVALTQDGTAVGSPGYMAPEQLDGSGSDARCDLFSLGIVLYQMLTGKHPFLRNSIPATIFATLHSNFQPVEQLRPDTPPYLISIVSQLLQSDRNKRIQSAAQLLNALRQGGRSRSEEDDRKVQAPLYADGLMGNTTRLKRISDTLQNLGRKGIYTVNSWRLPASLSRILPASIRNRIPFLERITRRLQMGNAPSSFIFFISLAGFVLFVILLFILFGISGRADERAVLKELHAAHWRGGPQRLIDTCDFLLEEKQYTRVKELARKLTTLRRVAAQAQILLARAALLDGDDREAIGALTKAAQYREWRRLSKGTLALLLRDCGARLSQRSADSALTATLAATVLCGRKNIVAEWTRSPSYWLRWNGVRLCAYLNMQVDSVEVYILDLQHAGSMRTRNRAATRLGELGDRRAIPYLKKAADMGLRDPIVSYTASLVLENYFKDSTASK